MRTKKPIAIITVGLLLCMAPLLLISCSNIVTGSGNVVTETRQVRYFNRISLRGIGNLIIEQGNRESLRIEAEDNIIPEITTSVSGNQLDIRFRRSGLTFGVRPTEPVNFFITVRDLNEVRLSGSGSARSDKVDTNRLDISTSGSGVVNMNVNADELTADGSGSSRFDMAGTVTRQQIDMSGSGRYNARDLASKECRIDISGSGNAVVRVSDRLDVDISGSGEVSYIGDPVVNQDISGSGRIRKVTD